MSARWNPAEVTSCVIFLFLLIATQVEAAQVVVAIDPNSAAPEKVTLEMPGLPPGSLDHDAADGSFHTDLSVPTGNGWTDHLQIVARWPDDTIRQLWIRTDPLTPIPHLTIYAKGLPATQGTLDWIAMHWGTSYQQMDFDTLLETYCVARDTYRGLANTPTGARDHAERAWFDSAYQLAARFPWMDRDEEIVALVARSDDNYYQAMLKQSVHFSWRDVDKVHSLIQNGELSDADRLTSYYLEAFTRLDPAHQQEVTDVARVNLKVLSGNRQLVLNLEKNQ